jgi:hypothetical protein
VFGQHKRTQKYSQSTHIVAIENVASILAPQFLMRISLVCIMLLIVPVMRAPVPLAQQLNTGLEGGCRDITAKYCFIILFIYIIIDI